MFRAEYCDQIYVGRSMHGNNSADTSSIDACVVGNEANSLVMKQRELLLLKYVNSGLDRGGVLSATGRTTRNRKQTENKNNKWSRKPHALNLTANVVDVFPGETARCH